NPAERPQSPRELSEAFLAALDRAGVVVSFSPSGTGIPIVVVDPLAPTEEIEGSQSGAPTEPTTPQFQSRPEPVAHARRPALAPRPPDQQTDIELKPLPSRLPTVLALALLSVLV